MSGIRWYVVHTKARAEWGVNKTLKERGYATFYPHYEGTVKHARKVIGVQKPAWPRYLLVGVGPDQGFYLINNCPGVSTVLHDADGPFEVPERIVARWRAQAHENGRLIDPPDGRTERKRFEKGEQVRIAKGAFEGFLATVELDAPKQVLVWVESERHKGKRAWIDRDDLESASP